MPTSILEIQVDDEAFKKFQADFGKYTIAVQDLPMAWGRIESAIANVGERIDAQTDALSKVIVATGKAVNQQNDYNRALRTTSGIWGGIVHWTRMAVAGGYQLLGIYGSIASRVTSAAVAMLKWGTVGALGAGLAGAGGLWGISSLASAAGATRRASQGMGLAPGQLRAYETNFSKMFDARGVLGNISSARNDPDRRWALISMGLDPNASTGELGLQAPARAKQIYEEGGQSLSYARARGLLEIFSEEDLQRLHAMTVQEIDISRQRAEQDRRQMAVSDTLARRWQGLATQFDRAGQVVQTVFLDALSPLAPEIEKLSGAFTEAVKTALSMDGMRMAINGLATGIRTAGDYISSAEFLDDIKAFGRAVESVWRAVSRVAGWINGLVGGNGGGGVGAVGAGGQRAQPGDPDYVGLGTMAWHGNANRLAARFGLGAGFAAHGRGGGRDGQIGGAPGIDVQEGIDPASWLAMGQGGQRFAALEARHGLPAGLLDRIWLRESGRGQNMGPSRAGAMGHFQFMPRTGREYGLTQPEHFNDLDRSSAAAAAYMRDLMVRYQGDLAKATAAYNWGMRNVDVAIADRGDRWRDDPRIPRETRDYLAAVVDPLLSRIRQQDAGAGRALGAPRVDLRVENPAGAQISVIGAAARAQ